MKKIFSLLVVMISTLSGWSQKYQQNSTNYDFVGGLSAGRFFSFPTGNGSPANPIALDSALKKAAFYFDSTNRKLWLYSPKTKLWDTLQIGLAASAWSTTGTPGTTAGTNFLGTTDSIPVMFKTQNYIAGLIGIQTSYSGTNVVWNGASPAGTTFGQTFMGKFAGENWGLTVNSNATVFGHGAMRKATVAGFGGVTPQMTVIGNNAGFYTYASNDANGNRSVLVGQMAAYRNFKGANNTYVGTYAGELNNNGYSNTAIGRDAMRSNIDGYNNTSVGLFSAVRNSTGILSIPVSAGGSGYTSASVSISAPLGGSPGGYVRTATATATVSAGAVTAITITDNGAGYTNDPHTYDFGTQGTIIVTITGDGTGATAGTPVMQSGNLNTWVGVLAGGSNEIGIGNTNIGYAATGRKADNYTTFLGYGTGVLSGYSASTLISNATAIGYNAKVACSNCIVLGDTSLSTKTGIGITNPTEALHVVGNIKGSNYIELPNISAPSTPGSDVGRIYMRADSLRMKNDAGTEFTLGLGGGGGVTTLAAIGSSANANGATISGSTLNLEPASASFGGVVTTGSQSFAGAKTFTGQLINSLTGAASTPSFSMTGNPYTAGTATTNHPLHYINGGTAPSTWSTAGTYTGINAVSGFTGNFVDYHVNGGASVASVNSEGTGTFNGVTIGKYGGAKGFETASSDLYFVTGGENLYFRTQTQGFNVKRNSAISTDFEFIYGGNTGYLKTGSHLSLYGSGSMETRLGAGNTENYLTIQTDGDVGIGQTSPAAKLDVLKTTEQLRLSYDGSNYTSFTVSSAGVLTIAPSGASITASKPVVLKNYTVATLPTGVQGMICYVTDATAPTYGATLVGGGAVVTIAFFDGTNWTAH